jgi:hypothetical protein
MLPAVFLEAGQQLPRRGQEPDVPVVRGHGPKLPPQRAKLATRRLEDEDRNGHAGIVAREVTDFTRWYEKFSHVLG